jgi:short-subunit dehydrogenase
VKKIMIIGATSAIVQAVTRLFATEGHSLFLVARNKDKLQAIATDLRLRGAGYVEACVMDVLEYNRHASVIMTAEEKMGGLDLAVVAHGTLPDQQACERSFDLTRQELEINCLSTISFLTHIANFFETKKNGTIAVISSVAGERGRQSNYVYGTAKGAVSIFLQGLRNRLQKCGVKVLTIKPGLVDTPMTSAFPKGMLWATPDKVARDIHHAIQFSKDITYSPFFWRIVMLIIRLIPERLFKNLRL